MLLCFTACSENTLKNQSENQNPVNDGSISTTNNKSLNTENENNINDNTESKNSENKPTEKIIEIYGETEIPNIPCGSDNAEGKASTITDRDAPKKCLNSMVFETHTFGDYK